MDRAHSDGMAAMIGVSRPVLDHGFIRLIDYMGDEAAIVQAARVSYGDGTKTPSDDRSLIRYLMRHWHTTPFEMCEIKLHIKAPIFVARQWMRHRTASVNEVSGRYSVLPGEVYIIQPYDMAQQSDSNKQGTGKPLGDKAARRASVEMVSAMANAVNVYDNLIAPEADGGTVQIAREQARIVLPLATYTEWYWKVDLHNLLHFLRLRLDEHAQREIRVYAEEIAQIVCAWMPAVWDAFEDYRLYSHTFSETEMTWLQKLIADAGIQPSAPDYTSKREQAVFKAALWGRAALGVTA